MNRPIIIYWRVGKIQLTSIFGSTAKMAMARDHDKTIANRIVCRQHIPIGAVAWRVSLADTWHRISELPAEWALTGV